MIAVFPARKYKPGKFLGEVLREIEEHTTYNGVLISENSRITVPIIDAPQFYQAIGDNLTTRLYSTRLYQEQEVEMLTQTKICTMHWSTICKSLSQRIGLLSLMPCLRKTLY